MQAWVDQVCAADDPILVVSAVVAMSPKFAQGQQPTEADRPAVIATLTKLRDMHTESKTAYDAIGPSPLPRGDELVAGRRKGLGEIVTKLQDYLDKARSFPPQGLDSPLLLAGIDAMTWKPEGPSLSDLQAPKCTK
ncbi:hypothetical protein SAMN05660733_04215 [Lentzea albidocapillata]|uniref:Uncharacterized protein n=1 Tax=Lentzea albidocapillata TaxID=40571 RepID=A0A1W2ENG5_9PSEU|nr:hypothetical protein SAMN05660733_04215 [Lentzea albidocapillata]